jgi:L-iditol 2-dehydrogenase
VFATDVDTYRLNLAKTVGADVVFNAQDEIPKLVKQHNDGCLADLVVLCAGVPSAVQQAFDSVQPGGTILFFAMTPPGVKIPFHLFDIWNKQITMVSTYAGAPRDIEEAIELLKTKQVEVSDMISHKLPLTDAAKGFQLVAQAKNSMKVILEP